jgi:hypothetical protein
LALGHRQRDEESLDIGIGTSTIAPAPGTDAHYYCKREHRGKGVRVHFEKDHMSVHPPTLGAPTHSFLLGGWVRLKMCHLVIFDPVIKLWPSCRFKHSLWVILCGNKHPLEMTVSKFE